MTQCPFEMNVHITTRERGGVSFMNKYHHSIGRQLIGTPELKMTSKEHFDLKEGNQNRTAV